MRIVLLYLLLSACATAPKTCEQLAWEDAGQALSKTLYAMDSSTEYTMLKNNSSIAGEYTGSLIDHDWPDTGNTSGPNSGTNYKGLSSREAFDLAMQKCGAKMP
jgi:hypothetical protein